MRAVLAMLFVYLFTSASLLVSYWPLLRSVP